MSSGHRPSHIALLLFLVLGACLDPKVEDPRYSHRLLPEDASVPSIEEDPRLSGVIAANDGLPGDTVPIATGFFAGETADYWDLGEGKTTVKPVWILRLRGEGDDGDRDIDHLPLVDTAPGDDLYGQVRSVFVVYITEAYRGERITSFEALEDAVELGLVEEPEPTGEVVVWPLVRTGAEVMRPSGGTYKADEVYYQTYRVPCLRLERFGRPLGEVTVQRGQVSPRTAYSLQRDLEYAPIDEASAGADLNDDGDMLDSNMIFGAGPSTAGYTGLFSVTSVTVSRDYVFGDITDVEELFPADPDGGPSVAETVSAYSDTGAVLLRPLVP